MAPVGGPVLAGQAGQGFKTRAEALEAERGWLGQRLTEQRV
jgi:hypothetical protein